MNLEKIYNEEDLFPREMTKYEKRYYGLLFYNEQNKESYDSNHAIIFENKISNLNQILEDIIGFYKEKGIKPMIYQSICDDGYFERIKSELQYYGFESWSEIQKYMVLSAENIIIPNGEINVQKVTEWKDEYGIEIFEKAGESWEIEVVKKALNNSNTLFFVAFYNDKPVGMTHGHITENVCRVDYVLVSNEHRNIGVGRSLIKSYVEYCKTIKVDNCYLWPDGETAEKIYYEAGFRLVEIKIAARAMYR